MASVLPIPALQDLKVTFHESILVLPLQETEKKPIFLCNIDQFLNYNIPTVHFFKANPDFPSEVVAKTLKMALEKVLVTYDFMAGRFKMNHNTGRLEIDCNAAGVGYVVASSEYSLHDLGNLVFPSLGFRQLAVQTMDNVEPEDDQPLCIFQLTSFKCGGFAIGMCTNHVLFDGLGAQTFMKNLATQAFDDIPLAVIPCKDRHLLAARSPPHVDFPHPELFKADVPVLGPGELRVPTFDCKREELDYKVFKLTPSAINFLKDKAKAESIDAITATTKITSYSVVAALMWRCKAFSYGGATEYDKDRIFTLQNVVDLRPRLNPPLPPSYCGNAVLVAYASAKCSDIEEWPFSRLVEMISEGPTRMTDEYIRSQLDWLEINKGFPGGDYMVSSWLRLRFHEVEYPWGKPVHSGPVVSHRKDICWVFPTNEGINALVSLPIVEMERFEANFREFFL